MADDLRVAHHPWRDRNTNLAGTAIDAVQAVAHHPWRDRNVRRSRCPPTRGVAHHPWRDRNTVPGAQVRPHPSSRSSPLEGSQPDCWITQSTRQTQVAHHPWRDRNAESAAEKPDHAVAHHPWRDRNSLSKPPTPSTDLASLITPGGIATPRRHAAPPVAPRSLITPGGIATSPRSAGRGCGVAVAHHPWRDRNIGAEVAQSAGEPGRSSPLEGSQRGGTGKSAKGKGTGRSSPLEGSQPVSMTWSASASSRSSPLEGSQRRVRPVSNWCSKVAHHPWRDRNPSAWAPCR